MRLSRRKPLPTDYRILNEIYERYYDEFASYSKDEKRAQMRQAKILVPIDIEAISSDLDVDPDIVFGRLYYHLEPKYGFKAEGEDVRVAFFARRVGEAERNCVNFPLLASVLASMRDDDRKYRIATWLAFVSLVISLVSFGLSLR